MILDVGTGNDDAVALMMAAMHSDVDMVEEVIVMGGAGKSGNRTPAAEFDMDVDAVAADVAFRTGIERLTVAPLDVTHEMLVSRDDLRRSREPETNAGRVVPAVTEYYIDSDNASDPHEGILLLSLSRAHSPLPTLLTKPFSH
ncbi:nucleoside hydrolase [Pseudonocardia kujensis]|uniref:nucleoside hydrolase n=1 Tax=Pseudonocardia kujensis TaxID=1128675 RepID=UPI001E5ACECF|nr:nucleoside hydrolase [Pseudonocardia kujensis]MCE0762333.1 nucleoside hydrolase [Pseudonocardia kujensis]